MFIPLSQLVCHEKIGSQQSAVGSRQFLNTSNSTLQTPNTQRSTLNYQGIWELDVDNWTVGS